MKKNFTRISLLFFFALLLIPLGFSNVNAKPADDFKPPILIINSPQPNNVLDGVVRMKAFARDLLNDVAFVSCDINKINYHKTDVSAPYIFVWDTRKVSDGVYYIKFTASDNAASHGGIENNIATRTVRVIVDNAFVVTEKIGVFFWASDAATSSTISKYSRILRSEGFTQIFNFRDCRNVYSACQQVDNYEDPQDIIFIYVIGHGNNDNFHSYTSFRPNGPHIYSNVFRRYLDAWESSRKCIVVESCHSGDWVDDFQSGSYLAISSSDETHNAVARGKLPGEGKFSYFFFKRVKGGYCAVNAFVLARNRVRRQHPKIGGILNNCWFS
jgi:hypothetical protein